MELSHMAGALVRFYLAKETVIEYLDKLVQRDLDRTGENLKNGECPVSTSAERTE